MPDFTFITAEIHTFQYFDGNGCGLVTDPSSCNLYSVVIITFNLDTLNVVANIVVNTTTFSHNSRALYLNSTFHTTTVELSNVTVFNNIFSGILIGTPYQRLSFPTIDILSSTFINNDNPLTMILPPKNFNLVKLQSKFEINLQDCVFSNNRAISNNDTGVATNFGVLSMYYHPDYSVNMSNCSFYNNSNGAIDMQLVPPVQFGTTRQLQCPKTNIAFTNVTVYNTTVYNSNASVSIESTEISIIFEFTNVNFALNHHTSYSGEVLLITNSIQKCAFNNAYIQFSGCNFDDNTAFDNMVALMIARNVNDQGNGVLISMLYCNFNNNFGGNNIAYIQGPTGGDLFSHVVLGNVTFSNNKGTALYCIITDLKFQQNVLFTNNKATSGAAIYFAEVHSVQSWDADIDVQFINNSAAQKGGALYFNIIADYCNVFPNAFNASFINNSADIAGNSIYFSIPQTCQVANSTINESSSFYIPNDFKFSQPSYVAFSPTVTSPHSIQLHPPEAIPVQNSSNNYYIQQSKMLGESIQFTTSILDYFNNVTEPVIFTINCNGCDDDYILSTYQITVHDKSLIELKVLSIIQKDVTNNVGISLTFLSVLSPVYNSINASLSIELSPCHVGYVFDNFQQCICYPKLDIVHCNDDHTEIRIGYWIGFVSGYDTSSICPSDYCNFAERMETSLGYYALSSESDDQCNSHRTGVACGECKPGYTLAYDSSDCINTERCSAGMTFLVVVLTIIYWFAVIAIVYGLMYLPFQNVKTLGYTFGIIYYYSIVNILLVSDVSEEVYQLVSILSSFARLTPEVFGQLCFVKGLSGIDQQFIHYFHALAVSLILVAIVLVTRFSPRLAMYVRRCIIRVICILILLSYTSLASTSLQLLRPLTFSDVHEVRTYSSPDIKYFTGRHLAYGIIAILCELIIVIGLPLFLLLEPLLSRKINFVKIKPLIDPFQQCYKNKYRWFAAYYLICRQVLIIIVIVGNRNYYNMLYYLQTACLIIAMIHGYIQPYKSNLLNGLDGVILLILVLVVNLSTFPSFSQSVSSGLTVAFVILPLLLFCFTVIRNILGRCYKGNNQVFQQLFNPADEDEDNKNERR